MDCEGTMNVYWDLTLGDPVSEERDKAGGAHLDGCDACLAEIFRMELNAATVPELTPDDWKRIDEKVLQDRYKAA